MNQTKPNNYPVPTYPNANPTGYPMAATGAVNAPIHSRNLQSQFVGSPAKMFWMRLGLILLSLIPFVGLPNAICIYKRWVCKNTYVVGVPMQFEGKAGELLLNIIKWGFFSIITIGIYALCLLPYRYKQWETANTIFGPVAG